MDVADVCVLHWLGEEKTIYPSIIISEFHHSHESESLFQGANHVMHCIFVLASFSVMEMQLSSL